MKFHQTTLANGLTLVGEQNEAALSAAIGFFVRAGARDESADVSGVSHFLEHMMFKGTDTRSALDITYELGAIGAQANAFTSEESTVYHVTVLPEYLGKAMDILCDMLRPALDQQEFDTEKKVILEEIALYQDRPNFLLYEAAMREYFAGHPAGHSVLGTTDSIGALSREQMLGYFKERYAPSNLVFGISGNFDWDRFCADAERLCGGWEAGSVTRDTRSHTPTPGSTVITKEGLQCAHLCFVASGPDCADDRRYPCHTAAAVLGDSTGSRVYWELVDKGIADIAFIDAEELEGAGVIWGYVSALPDRLDQAGEILRSIMCSPLKFEDAALARVKTKLRTRLVLNGESSTRRLMALGFEWMYRKRHTTIDAELERLDRVSRDEIGALVETFSFEPMTEVRLIPA